MKYEYELKPLREWVRTHPGLSAAGIAKSIQAIPNPTDLNNSKTWKGTRWEFDLVPTTACLAWKLRYLELCGDVDCKKGKWFPI